MMPALRQIGMAIAISVISLGLVIGGLSLSLSENFTPLPSTATLGLPTLPVTVVATSTASPQVLPTETLNPTVTNSVVPPPTTCIPPSGWISVVVAPADDLVSLALEYNTTAQLLAQANCLSNEPLVVGSILYVPPLPATSIPTSTRIPCGSPFGWVLYTVRQGDTLYHIATMFGISTSQLQQANCLGSSTTIHPGQSLWVPNRPPQTPVTPGLTLIPTIIFPTETAIEIPLTPTPTPEPDSTNTPVTPES